MKTCPSSKNRYDTETQAQYAVRDSMLFRNSPPLTTYFCLLCNGYHLTSSIKTIKIKRKAK